MKSHFLSNYSIKASLLVFTVLAFSHNALGYGFGPAKNSFCIQHFNAYGPLYASQVEQRTQKMTDHLNGEKPACEIIQLIEVWNSYQILQIIEALRPHYPQIDSPNLKWKIGLMTASQLPLKSSQAYRFNINNEDGLLDSFREIFGVKKAFTVNSIAVGESSEEVYFVNTHLHPTSQVVRLVQILDIFNWRYLNLDKKMILSGDFNAETGSLERVLLMNLLKAQDALAEQWGGQYPQGICTYCENNPRSWLSGDHVFDYIFYSNIAKNNQTSLVLKAAEINLKGDSETGTWSDHYGVRAHFELTKQSSRFVSSQSQLAYFIRVLDVSAKVLREEDKKIYQPYLRQLQQMKASLEAKKGDFWNYVTVGKP